MNRCRVRPSSHHATNIANHKKFFADTLGGIPITLAGRDIVKFPNVLVFIRQQDPKGGTRGTSVNHLGFSVPNIRQTVDKLKANGYKMVTREEATSNWQVNDDIATMPGRDAAIAFVMGPQAGERETGA